MEADKKRWNCTVYSNHIMAKYNSETAAESDIDTIDLYVKATDIVIQWIFDHTVNLYLDRK